MSTEHEQHNGPRMLTMALLFSVPAWLVLYVGWHVVLWAIGETPPK